MVAIQVPRLRLLLLAAVLTGATPASAQVIAATAQAQPAVHRGACPFEVRFTGGITSLNRNQPVVFQWIGSHGLVGPVHTLPPGQGGRGFEYVWPVDRSMRGWAQVQVLSPQRFLSNRAGFEVICADRR
jgi:hypothetical protein